MRRGTTPTHTFTLPFNATGLKIRVSYAQGGRVVVRKTEADCVVSGNDIVVKLTQQETLRFNSSAAVEIQIKVLTAGNDVPVSGIYTVPVERCLDDEVLS